MTATSTLSPQQTKVVESSSPTIVCVAGPGSGKTRTLVERINRLIDDGVHPGGIVVITFTNAAANEIKHRIQDGIGLGYVGTLHGFMLRHIQQYGHGHGPGRQVSVIDEDQSAALLLRIADRHNYKGTSAALTDLIKDGPVNRPPVSGRYTAQELIAATFFREMKECGMVTFDTLLHYGAIIAPAILGYSHLFVDEFQDSADIDAEIYKALPIPYKFYVGDPDQSIYGFRGGNVMNLLNMAWGHEVCLLESNYRSDRSICILANRLIGHNLQRVEKDTVAVSDFAGEVGLTVYDTTGQEMARVASAIGQAAGTSAVLLRTNHLVETWTDYLRNMGIPVVTKKPLHLPPDWRLAKLFIACCNEPRNNATMLWLAEQTIGPEAARKLSLKAAMQKQSLNSLFLDLPSGLTIRATIDRSGQTISAHGVERLNALAATLEPTAGIPELLLAIAEAEGRETEEGTGVVVATMHGAKGREWDNVWLPSFEDEIIPGTRKDVDVEEERRLAYVAVTRARHRLHLSWCKARQPQWGSRWGTPAPATPSRFGAEMEP